MGKSAWKNWYEKYLEKLLPTYALIPVVSCFLWNCLIYWGTQRLILGLGLETHELLFPVDEMIPFQPAWVLIYVLSFPFWVVSYVLTARENDRKTLFRFVCGDMASRLICAVIFLAYPTTNVRPAIEGSGLLELLMGLIYSLDPPLNLFPSIHCLASTMSWLGIRNCSRIPAWYRWGTLVFALLIFASTMFTRQHGIADVIGGILIALICYGLSMRWGGDRVTERLFHGVNRRIFGEDAK